MKQLAVLTVAEGNAECLQQLHDSLVNQRNPDFTWIVVDRGADPNTEQQVQNYVAADGMDIVYQHRAGETKTAAYNCGLDLASDFQFVLVIDENNTLEKYALEFVAIYAKKYESDRMGAIHFNRRDINDAILEKPVLGGNLEMNIAEWRQKGRQADGYIGYYPDKLGSLRFPDIKGETYMAPSVLTMMLCQKFEMTWACAIIGKMTENDAFKRPEPQQNPISMSIYASLIQQSKVGIRLRWKYSVLGFGCRYYAGLEGQAWENYQMGTRKLLGWAKFPGHMLAASWKKGTDNSDT